jgi:hypothetical protein
MATTQADIQNKIRVSKKTAKDKNLESYIEILEQMPDSETIKSEKIKLSSEEDLESLLKLAEELRNGIEKLDDLNFKFKFIIGIYFISPIIFYLFVSSSELVSFIYLTVVIISGYFYLKHIIKRNNSISTTKLMLKEVLQLLREVHGTIAEREDWSILKRAEFRIRLSRFDLSEKKESIFSFFS